MPAIEDHHRDRDAAERLHHRRRAKARAVGAIDQRENPLEQGGGAGLFILLHAIGFDVPRALEGLGQQGHQLPGFRLGVRRYPPHPSADRVAQRPSRWN